MTWGFRDESGCSVVFVDHAAKDLVTSYRGVVVDGHYRIVVRRMLVETLVRTVVVEVMEVFVEDERRVLLIVDQDSVGAFLADGAHESFGVAVRPWCSGRNLDCVDVLGGEDGVEVGGELGVSVSDEEPERLDAVFEGHQQIACLLSGPGAGRVGGDAQEMHSAGADLHHEQDIE